MSHLSTLLLLLTSLKSSNDILYEELKSNHPFFRFLEVTRYFHSCDCFGESCVQSATLIQKSSANISFHHVGSCVVIIEMI